MCRHLAYLGPVVPLADLLLTPSHSLLRQSWEPADMRGGGTVNADGFGIGWYPPDDEHLDEPVRYRRNIPIWADERLPVTDLLTLDAPTDSALLWALVLDRLRSGDAPADAVTGVLADVVAAAPESRLNLLLTDGEQLVATAWSHSLSVRRTAESVAVSSEPWDTNDETWRPVPDRHVVLETRETLEVHPMEGPL